MENEVENDLLDYLWSALKEKPPRPRRGGVSRIFDAIAKQGWAYAYQLEDVFNALEPRLSSYKFQVKDMAATLGLRWESVFYKPKAKSTGCSGFEALRAEDAAAFIVDMERLGFDVDATGLVEQLLPALKSRKKALLSASELKVYWFAKTRHKNSVMQLCAKERRPIVSFEEVTTKAGYKVVVSVDDAGKPVLLSVHAPKYRQRKEPIKTVCPDCGDTWYRGDPDSSAGHRREHKRRMYYLNPQPLSKFLDERTRSNAPELVTMLSPAWKHKEMYERAYAFKREFGYDFIQWGSPTGDNDPNVQGFMFADEAGRIVGACAFRDRTKEGATKHKWGMQWIWICPMERRRRHLTQRWSLLKERFGDFIVEPPVSESMQAFLRKHGDERLLR